MKRHLALTTLSVMLLTLFLVTVDAWARAGGGSSGGSRGSRSYSAPARPSQGVSPSRPSSPSSVQSPMPQRSGWMSGIMGGIGGLVLGGLIGSMLFGGMGGLGGLGGGIGLMEILIVAALAYFAYSYLKRRRATAPAPAGYPTASYSGTSLPQPTWRPEPAAAATAVAEPLAGPGDLERGVAHIRQMDAAFDPARFGDTASDLFFKVQGAWMGRDMGTVRDRLTPEMFAVLQRDCDRLRADHRINRLENIAVRSVEVTEAWQESGQDYVTVAFVANLLDFTTDESGTQILEGSRTEPVKFEEYWTLTRPVGPNAWKLSAIQQPQ